MLNRLDEVVRYRLIEERLERIRHALHNILPLINDIITLAPDDTRAAKYGWSLNDMIEKVIDTVDELLFVAKNEREALEIVKELEKLS